MSAQPAEHREHDPERILRDLPIEERERFLHDYRSALDAAHETWRYRQLQEVLRLWGLRAAAYSRPGFAEAARDAEEGRAGRFQSAEDVIPGWSDLVKDA